MHMWNLLFLILFSWNCYLPMFTGANSISLQMMEETEVDTEVGNILARLPIDIRNSDLTYVSDSQFFRVSNQGKLIVSKKVDLETICMSDKQCCGLQMCRITFSILVNNKRREIVENIDIQITVLDKNDHKPKFSSKTQNVVLSEFAQIGTSISLKPANDGDISIPNRIQSYQLIEKTNTFSLDLSGLPSLSLVVGKRLDYEAQSSYDAQLKACDQESCTNQTLKISIKDENDNSPIFLRENYNFTVKENTSIGSIVGKVQANDRDSGKLGEVRYSISQDSDSDLRSTFAIRPNNGDIILRQKLNAKSRSSYVFSVLARDQGPINSKQAMVRVELFILDLNDYSPVIKLMGRSDLNPEIKVEENKGPKHLATLKVTDEDLGDNAIFNCRLEAESERLFELRRRGNNAEIFTLRSRSSFDHEKQQRINVKVICRDNGQPSLESTKIIPIRITDENEFKPHFKLDNNNYDHYSSQIEENSPLGTRVLKVTALDNDKSAVLRYTIDSYGEEYFQIDSVTGQISCSKNPLDREHVPSITFTVRVTDAIVKPNTASIQVKIRVLDINDNPPTFPPTGLPQFSVIENTPPARLVEKLTAQDFDEGNNAKITFSLKNTWNGHNYQRHDGYFNVMKSGYLETLTSLDREVCDLYILEVAANDNPSPTQLTKQTQSSLSSVVNVTLRVLDENDNAPQWTYPDLPMYNISDAMLPGDHLIKINAIDRDTGPNGQVRYSIKQQQYQQMESFSISSEDNHLTYFTVNYTNGQLWVSKRLLPGTILLLLEARDLGQPSQQTQLELMIHVSSSNGIYASVGNSRLNTTIIAVMISITALVSLFLLVAIFCVRRRPPTPPLHDTQEHPSSSMIMIMAKDNNGTCSASLAPSEWLAATEGETNNNCSDTMDNGGYHHHYKASSPTVLSVLHNNNNNIYTPPPHQYPHQYGYRSSLPTNQINQDNCNSVQMHTFAPPQCLTYEPVDGDSGDSGRGPSEEGSNIHHLTQDGSGNYFSLRGPIRHSTFRPPQTPSTQAKDSTNYPCYILPEDVSPHNSAGLPAGYSLISALPTRNPNSSMSLYCPYNSLTLPHHQQQRPSQSTDNKHYIQPSSASPPPPQHQQQLPPFNSSPLTVTQINNNPMTSYSQCSTPRINLKLTPMHLRRLPSTINNNDSNDMISQMTSSEEHPTSSVSTASSSTKTILYNTQTTDANN